MTRHDEMMNFLNNHLTAGFTVESLAGDASFRRYHRIHFKVASEHDKDKMTYLLMDAPPDKESVTEFVSVAGIMSEAVNVPDIIAQDIAKGFLLLQDFGTTEFAHLIKDDKANMSRYYQRAYETLIKLQDLDIDVDLPAYSDEKLNDEMDLFSQWFSPYINVSFTADDELLWERLKKQVITDVQSQPKVIVHRDYHSRNLMQDKASDELGVIDFQDAVIGADTYDLVSLVRDAYIDVDETWVNEQIGIFYELKNPNMTLNDFTKNVNIMGIQRHLKVLGIFIRLYQRDSKARYLQNIPKVMNDLCHELNWLSEQGGDDIYTDFKEFICQKILPTYNQVFISA
ncbi:aminoglycoside phosphotransferase family protein [Moraxella bovis]|uniref:Predicted phosphotransferase related to Ser/Thr protein kinases n=1 Tax=Moraxella bovis TaxID=476 RepID=A0A378Q0D2_MORBO|nr:phosphotransferase [Moraxella bovis]STY94125.1 Predicted phosphotransferase related to Ser/Thr protein kinases [Moraxella bovis]